MPRLEAREGWSRREVALFKTLRSPFAIQLYLNRLEYDAAPGTRSPRWVIRENKANCFEGALLAAAGLRFLGHPPRVVDLRTTNDDDHVIAVFKACGSWGAVAKSNFTTLRFREPVYRTLRELAMSYFDLYFNTLGEKSMREYSMPMNLARFDAEQWMTTDEDISDIGDALDEVRHVRLLAPGQVRGLNRVDRDVFRAGMLVANKAGLYPAKRR